MKPLLRGVDHGQSEVFGSLERDAERQVTIDDRIEDVAYTVAQDHENLNEPWSAFSAGVVSAC